MRSAAMPTPLLDEVDAELASVWRFILEREVEAPERFQARLHAPPDANLPLSKNAHGKPLHLMHAHVLHGSLFSPQGAVDDLEASPRRMPVPLETHDDAYIHMLHGGAPGPCSGCCLLSVSLSAARAPGAT